MKDVKTVEFAIYRRRLLCTLLVIVGALTLGHVAAIIFYVKLEREFAFGIVPLFHFDREGNLPAFYSAFALCLAGFLAFAIHGWRRVSNDGPSKPWAVMSGVLFFLAIDEGASLHDQLDVILSAKSDLSGWLAWPWVIPYALLVIVVAFIFLPFYLRLPTRYQVHFGLGAAFYVVGAIGFEMLGASAAEIGGERSLRYSLLVTIEELLEMTGVILVIQGLTDYLIKQCPGLSICLKFRN